MQNSLRLTVSRVQETHKSVQATAITLHCLSELESKKLLLITSHSSDMGQTDVGLTWKPPPWGLSLTISGVAMQATKGEKQLVLTAVKSMDHSIDHCSKIPPKVQQWYLYLEAKQPPCNWIKGLYNRREFMTGSVNPANCLQLVRPWTLEENPLTATAWNWYNF